MREKEAMADRVRGNASQVRHGRGGVQCRVPGPIRLNRIDYAETVLRLVHIVDLRRVESGKRCQAQSRNRERKNEALHGMTLRPEATRTPLRTRWPGY